MTWIRLEEQESLLIVVPPIFWIGFNVFVFALLALDLGVFNRKAHVVGFREAGIWTAFWVGLALAFNAALYLLEGHQAGIDFLTSYLTVYSLSVDNIFVFVLIFAGFAVPQKYQPKALFWGIVGALVLRGVMIAVGGVLISRFAWILYLFGAFLVYTGLRMLWQEEDEEVDLEHNIVLRFVRRIFPVTSGYRGNAFVVREGGRRMLTPLLLAVLVLIFADAVFALDSTPASFAITQDIFIVYTSNIFAILGLRSLYFLVSGVLGKFVYLRYGLAVILSFVGVKMLIAWLWHIPNWLSLAVIVATLAVTVAASVWRNRVEGKLEAE